MYLHTKVAVRVMVKVLENLGVNCFGKYLYRRFELYLYLYNYPQTKNMGEIVIT